MCADLPRENIKYLCFLLKWLKNTFASQPNYFAFDISPRTMKQTEYMKYKLGMGAALINGWESLIEYVSFNKFCSEVFYKFKDFRLSTRNQRRKQDRHQIIKYRIKDILCKYAVLINNHDMSLELYGPNEEKNTNQITTTKKN